MRYLKRIDELNSSDYKRQVEKPKRINQSKRNKEENGKSDLKDFRIRNHVLTKYLGESPNVVIPDGVEKIGNDAFWGCSGLKSVVIPNSVKIIGTYAFSNCKNLESINIPDGVEEIDDNAFWGCSGLKSIDIPDKFKEISTFKKIGFDPSLNKEPKEEEEKYESSHSVIRINRKTKINLSLKDFEKEKGYSIDDRVKVYDYCFHHPIEYYDEDGSIREGHFNITGFYEYVGCLVKDQKKKIVYRLDFNEGFGIGTFRTAEEAVDAGNKWINFLRTKNHKPPVWIYDQSKGDYQMVYSF